MATGRVNTPSLNLRDQPNGQVIAMLTGGTLVTLLVPELPGDWLFVSANVDQVVRFGWVARRFIDTSDGGAGSTGPTPAGGDIFELHNWEKYRTVLGRRESSNNYRSVNQFGYCGRWQFGAGALIDGGYVKRGARNRDLINNEFWTGLNGVSSREDWLSNTAAQDAAMLEYTKAHNSALIRRGGLQPNSSIARCAGLLAAAHLLGVGGAMSFVQGTIGHDANGVTAADYYKLLSEAFGGSGSLEP